MTALPSDFILGVSSSGHQIEGHNDQCDWWDFEQAGHIKGGDRTGPGADYWNRYRDDVAMLRDLGMQAHRFGIEWARVEPRPGEFDNAALDRYADMVRVHREAGVTPYVALSHFTLPRWMATDGAWLNPAIVERLGRYAERCARHLGPDVEVYFTLNEPGTVASMAYGFGVWPPRRKSVFSYTQVLRRSLLAHVAMAQAVRGACPGAKVGIIQAWPEFLPLCRHSPGDHAYAALTDWLFNGAFHAALCTGRLPPPLGTWDRVDGLQGSVDVYGANFYLYFLADWLHPRHNINARQGERASQVGWAEATAGLGKSLARIATLGKPILITENGLATDDEQWRMGYVRRHLDVALAARQAGIDVRGYFYWSYLDNFEWAEGWHPTFGLVGFDRQTFARRIKLSGHWYGAVAKQRRLDPHGDFSGSATP